MQETQKRRAGKSGSERQEQLCVRDDFHSPTAIKTRERVRQGQKVRGL